VKLRRQPAAPNHPATVSRPRQAVRNPELATFPLRRVLLPAHAAQTPVSYDHRSHVSWWECVDRPSARRTGRVVPSTISVSRCRQSLLMGGRNDQLTYFAWAVETPAKFSDPGDVESARTEPFVASVPGHVGRCLGPAGQQVHVEVVAGAAAVGCRMDRARAGDIKGLGDGLDGDAHGMFMRFRQAETQIAWLIAPS
jgi:hypothetical protein